MFTFYAAVIREVVYTELITAPFKNSKFNRQFVFRVGQLSVRRLPPASDYCRARGNHIVEHSSGNETVQCKETINRFHCHAVKK